MDEELQIFKGQTEVEDNRYVIGPSQLKKWSKITRQLVGSWPMAIQFQPKITTITHAEEFVSF